MLSILIPVYNFNIVPLVTELHDQATKASIPFEIIVLDDCSSELLRHQNKDVVSLPGVRFHELDKNIGRARIRNRLAEMAVYSTLLYLDCDSEIPTRNYIINYLPFCDRLLVACGGRLYRPDPPDEHEFLLRWLYGIRREQLSVAVRSKNPYRSFMTNNFLIPRETILQIQFDESIIHYGHEDTLFGLELKKRGVQVRHIQNPLLHIGLEISWEFIRKTSEGVENLFMLLQNGKIDRNDIQDIRVLKVYEIMRKLRLEGLYQSLYDFVASPVMRNLLGSNPSLFALDLYKLSLFTNLVRKGKTQDLSFD
ncbi:MAG: glycosyltransferase [Bacteroidales bacterium]|nr:glycosyltransferase [Bacteroidales bacterium]